jgi:hypothetical protein
MSANMQKERRLVGSMWVLVVLCEGLSSRANALMSIRSVRSIALHLILHLKHQTRVLAHMPYACHAACQLGMVQISQYSGGLGIIMTT